MKDVEDSCKIALVQAEPVIFDKSASLKKALQWIANATTQKLDIIVFPELFIPGYPVGMNFGFRIGIRSEDGRKDWKRYYDASVVAGKTEFQQLAKAAQETGAYISLSFFERDAVNGTLYNSNVIFEPDGHYLTEPVWDKETIIYAELDMRLPAACKMEHDVVGHYVRPDILELKINDK